MNSEIKDALRERIRACADMVGSGDELSRRSGVPRRTLENYLSGRSEPKATALALIAEAAAVSLDWLVLGKRTPPSEDAIDQPVDESLLLMIIEELERFRSERHLSWSPERKARLITYGYAMMQADQDEGRKPSVEALRLMLKAAS